MPERMSAADLHSNLRGFTGSENFFSYKLGIRPVMIRVPNYGQMPVGYSDGAKYLFEKAEAHWLLNEIAINMQKAVKGKGCDRMHFWDLVPNDDGGATLLARKDTGCPPVFKYEIPFTDFPFQEVDGKKQTFTLYAGVASVEAKVGYMIYLPSEY